VPSFTIESTYRLPIFRHRTYQAATAEDACRLAVQDNDWEGQKEDYENSGATYLTGIWPGVDSAYAAPSLALPPGFAEGDNPPLANGTKPVTPTAAPLMPRCRHCGSADICRDANAICRRGWLGHGFPVGSDPGAGNHVPCLGSRIPALLHREPWPADR
jgi:hypothetical protein